MTKRTRASLAAVACLVAASCGVSTAVSVQDTAQSSESEIKHRTAEAGSSQVSDGLPGFPARFEDGCNLDSVQEVELEEREWPGWVPIAELVRRSGRLISGTITDVSAPRISSTKINPKGGTLDLAYFRIVTINSDLRSLSLTQEAPKQDAEVHVMVLGAGPDVDSKELCFGPDGSQDQRELSVQEGDQVLILATSVSEYPMENPGAGPIEFLERGIAGIWLVNSDGSTRSAVPGYDLLDATSLRDRISEEFRRKDVPIEELPESDSLAFPPSSDATSPPVTAAPEPPGIDAPNSPTVPTPDEVLEEEGDDK